ncbi:hypothetical protein D9M73_50850 [compost metagenome]
MTGIAIQAFRGAVPRISARLLNDNQAQRALNCKITSGRIDPLKGLGLVHTSDLAGTIATMYRYRHLEAYNWLVWPRVVDVTRSPVAQDSLGRFYYTGDGEPRMSTYADAISGGGPYPAAGYVLGVTPPPAVMAIAVVGGALADETRAYVYTFVTAYGEESGPSPALVKTGKPDGSWNITGMSVALPNSGTISGAVKDTPLPGQVEVTLDTVAGLAAYEELTFAGVGGMTDLNGTFAIVSINTGTNKVVVNLATTQTYSAGSDTWARKAPHHTAGMVKRIYRTIGTNTDYKLVAEIPVADATYNDTIPSATVSLNNGIPTLDTLVPLKNMHSLVLLSNGALAGAVGNQICFSEQGKPYSWPLSNRYTVPGTIVALVPAGNSVIILTDNFPYLATATVPEAASVAKIPGDTLAPCLAKQGVVDIGSGAIYPSHDGLYVVTTSGARNITESLYSFDEWTLLYPATFKAAFYNQRYHAMHQTADTEQDRILVLNVKEPDSIIEVTEQVDALFANPWDGLLYVGQANKIYQWDQDDDNRYLAFWESREYQLGQPVNFTIAQLQARFEDIVPANTSILDANLALLANSGNVNGAIGSARVGRYGLGRSALRPVPQVTTGSVQFTLVKDGVAVYTKQVMGKQPFRLPSGFKSDTYSMQITTSIPVYSVVIAQGAVELRQASV